MMSRINLAILISFLISLANAQYKYLVEYHPECGSDVLALTSGCMAAMHRLCVDNKLGSAAYPQEFGTNKVSFLCIDTPYYEDSIAYFALADCEPTPATPGVTQSTLCYSNAHRLCDQDIRRGTVGIPQEFGPTTIGLACASATWHNNLSITELQHQHRGCSSPAMAQEGACIAATHRFCAAQGNFLGGLIAELGHGEVAVACIAEAKYVTAEFNEVPKK